MDQSLVDSCIYFGCWSKESRGHYAYDKNGFQLMQYKLLKLGLPFNPKSLDQFFFSNVQSKSYLMNIPEWTVLWMSDQSGDSRSGSNSSFIVKGDKLTLEEVIDIVKIAFPEQFLRINSKCVIF